MAETVYVLSSIVSLACVALLLRAYRQSRVALLLWCSICFVGLAANNILLFIDKVIVPDRDLAAWRALPAAVGVAALVFGLIWRTDER